MDTLALATVAPHPLANHITVGTAVEKFLAQLPFLRRKDGKLLAEGTRQWYRYELARLVKVAGDWGVMATVPMLAVTAEQMAAWPVTASFGECVRRLYSWHDLPKPRGFTVPPKGRRDRTASRQEIAQLLRGTRSARHILWFGWDTGARPAELRLVRWYQVNLKNRTIVWDEFKAQHLRKDGVSQRIIPLSRMASRILASWKRRRDAKPDDLVFLNWRGEPWTCNALTQAVRKACVRAGLDPEEEGGERIVAYSMRHTFADVFAQRMLKQGTYDITLLKDIMGHASIQTTCRYLHRRGVHLVEGRDKFMERSPR